MSSCRYQIPVWNNGTEYGTVPGTIYSESSSSPRTCRVILFKSPCIESSYSLLFKDTREGQDANGALLLYRYQVLVQCTASCACTELTARAIYIRVHVPYMHTRPATMKRSIDFHHTAHLGMQDATPAPHARSVSTAPRGVLQLFNSLFSYLGQRQQ